MTKEQIFNKVQNNILILLPDVQEQIEISDSLKNLGANSVDRMDIIISTMEDIDIKIPLVNFGDAKNIEDIVTVLWEAKEENGD